jgi:hypothetical protein
VATWAEFANAEPDLAAFARERMQGRIVSQATLRLDGGPRAPGATLDRGSGGVVQTSYIRIHKRVQTVLCWMRPRAFSETPSGGSPEPHRSTSA